MSGSMSRRGLEPDLVSDSIVRIDQLRVSRIDHRTHRVLNRVARVFVVGLGPVIPLGAAYQVTRIGEGRNPLAVLERGVPSHVIDVEMSTHDDVDIVARVARFLEISEERHLEIAPCRIAAHLVIADAGIDHYALALGFKDQRVDRHPELAFLVTEGRKQPTGLFLDVLWYR